MNRDEIKENLATLEERIAKAQRFLNHFGVGLERYAKDNNLTPYQTAGIRHTFGYATKHLCDALQDVVDMHDQIAEIVIRPRTGDGK